MRLDPESGGYLLIVNFVKERLCHGTRCIEVPRSLQELEVFQIGLNDMVLGLVFFYDALEQSIWVAYLIYYTTKLNFNAITKWFLSSYEISKWIVVLTEHFILE